MYLFAVPKSNVILCFLNPHSETPNTGQFWGAIFMGCLHDGQKSPIRGIPLNEQGVGGRSAPDRHTGITSKRRRTLPAYYCLWRFPTGIPAQSGLTLKAPTPQSPVGYS